MNLPLYTALTAACILFLQLGLMLSVGLRRVKYRQGIGDGGHDDLSLLVRRHGNLAENGAIFVVVLAVLEIVGGAPLAVAAFGGTFVLVRVAHAIGLTLGDGPNAARFVGASGTALTGFAMAGYLMFIAAGQLLQT